MISVVVPTFDRPRLLATAVTAWATVDPAVSAEIVVVDDGSGEACRRDVERLVSLASTPRRPIRLIRQDNRGLAAARNAGAVAARGAVLLFADDDIVPTCADPLARHLAAQRGRPGVWVSHMRIPDAVAAGPFGRYWQRRMHAGTDRRRDGSDLGMGGFWFATASIARSTFVRHSFDEAFRGYGWEEHELGVRLYRSGLRARFLRGAAVEHRDPVTLRSQVSKMEAMGRAAWTFSRLHPGPRVAWWTGTAAPSRWLRTVAGLERRGDRLLRLGLDAYDDAQYAAILEGAYTRGLRLGAVQGGSTVDDPRGDARLPSIHAASVRSGIAAAQRDTQPEEVP